MEEMETQMLQNDEEPVLEMLRFDEDQLAAALADDGGMAKLMTELTVDKAYQAYKLKVRRKMDLQTKVSMPLDLPRKYEAAQCDVCQIDAEKPKKCSACRSRMYVPK